MASDRTRREFLGNVGQGMLVASVGFGTAFDMGLTTAWADEGSDRLSFGPLEPLVAFMQETPIHKLIPVLVGKLQSGTDLKQLVAAATLANARTFGGEDYIVNLDEDAAAQRAPWVELLARASGGMSGWSTASLSADVARGAQTMRPC